MSVPFSNTHLRVPRGFGAVLEGLAREVLRDQPENIPAYAAQYFDKLLQQREESGMDPAEWAAKLEDRFYNNHAFKPETFSPEKESSSEDSGSKETTTEFQTEDESSYSVEDTTLYTKHPYISDKTDLAEGTEENIDQTEKLTISLELQHTEKTSGTDEQSSTDEVNEFSKAKPDQVIRPDNEVDDSPAPDYTTPELDSDLSNLLPAKETSNVDMRPQEVGASEYEGEDQRDGAFEDKEIVSSEGGEHTVVSEPLEHLALVDVDVCASELGGTKATLEDGFSQEGTYSAEEGETMKPQLEENAVELLPNQYEIPQDNQQEAEDHAQKPNERETTETEASHEETNKSFVHSENSLDDNAIAKTDSLGEISVEDVPVVQSTTEVLENETNRSLEHSENSLDDNAIAKTDSLGEISVEDVPVVQSTTEVLENEETNRSLEHSENSLDDNAIAKKDSLGEISAEDVPVEKKLEKDASLEVMVTYISAIPQKDEFKELDTSSTDTVQEHLPEQDQQSPRMVGESQPEDVKEEKQGTFKEKEEIAHSEVQEQSEELGKEETITPSGSADWKPAEHEAEERPGASEEAAAASASKSDEEDGSRPQEEEDIMDIPLDDPEANRAAAKIQAGFRGHMTRKKMKPEDKTEGEEVSSTEDELNSSQGGSETGRSGTVERDDTSVPEQ